MEKEGNKELANKCRDGKPPLGTKVSKKTQPIHELVSTRSN